MSLSIKVEQRGVDLQILADKLGGRVLQPLITSLAERGEALMREKAPRRTGRLMGSIHREVRSLEAVIGPRAPYAIYVEFGTRPHEIRPIHARALRFEAEGHIIFAAWVQHPGTRPQPFIREAAENLSGEIGGVFRRMWREAAG